MISEAIRPNTYQPLIKLPVCDENSEICPASLFYVVMTDCLRRTDSDLLFIRFRKPLSDVTSQTLRHKGRAPQKRY